MPNKPKTPVRSFRIADDPYLPAKEKARGEGTDLSALVNEWMWQYVHGDENDE